MFTIEILTDGVWQKASEHTLEVDAQAQMERFIESGIDAANLRFGQDANGQA